jgi:YVTN family beta-propeller protein
MEKSTVGVIVLLLFLGAACAPQPRAYRSALENEGELHLYLQPLPQDAHRVSFSVSAIFAVRSDGETIPLQQFMTELRGEELLTVQKRLAWGLLPPGLYKGLSMQIGAASVLGQQGMATLLIPDDPLFVEKEFTVIRRGASTLFLSLDPGKLLGGGFRFTPVFSLANPRRQLTSLLGFATNSGSNVVSVFNKLSMQVVDTIATGSGPKGAVIDQRRGWVYIALAGDDSIEAIEVATAKIFLRLRLQLGDEPSEIALSPDGEILVSANYGSNTATVIETSGLRMVERIRLPAEATSVVMGGTGTQAYVLHASSNAISLIDLSRPGIVRTQTFEESPVRGAINTEEDRLYVITRNSPNLLVLDPRSLGVIDKIFVGTDAASIMVDPKTDLLYVGKRTGNVDVIDPSSLMSMDVFRVIGNSVFLNIDDDENALFVALPNRKTIQKLNLVSKRAMGVSEVGEGAYAVVLMGQR